MTWEIFFMTVLEIFNPTHNLPEFTHKNWTAYIYNKCILLLENTYFFLQIIFGLTWHILSMALWHFKDLVQPFFTFFTSKYVKFGLLFFFWLSLCFFCWKCLFLTSLFSSPFWLSDVYPLSLTPLRTSALDDRITRERGQGGESLLVFPRVYDVSVF